MFDVKTRGKGARKNPLDLRDYRLEKVLGAISLPTQFSIKDKIGKIKDQGSSESCVAQATSYYAEVLNKLETGQNVQLSARDVYSLIFLKGGGAYIRDAANKMTNSGIIPEADAPSLDKGNPPSEQFMENRSDITLQEVEEGQTYMAKSYCTFNNKNFDTYKKAIFQGQGAIGGAEGNDYCWSAKSGILSVPEKGQANWAHSIFFTGFLTLNGTDYLEFVNSWGQDWGNAGFGLMPREYVEAGLCFNPTTLVDLPNAYFPTTQKAISVLQKLISLYQALIQKLKAGFKLLTKQ